LKLSLEIGIESCGENKVILDPLFFTEIFYNAILALRKVYTIPSLYHSGNGNMGEFEIKDERNGSRN